MQKKNIPVFLALITLLFAASCAKEGPAGPTGPPGPTLTGNISGHVVLLDKYGSKVLSGYNNVSIFLKGSATGIHPDSTTGTYTYASLITGVYSLAAYGTGYDYTEHDNLQLVAGTLSFDLNLSAIPDSFLNTFSAALNAGASSDSITITCAADSRPRNFIVFLNKTDTVSNLPTNYIINYIWSIPANATIVTMQIPKQDLVNAGFASGSTVYFAAYSYVVNDASYYEDQNTARNVYFAVNPHPLLGSAVAP